MSDSITYLEQELKNTQAANHPLGEQCVRFLNIIRQLIAEVDEPMTISHEDMKAIRKLTE